MRKMKRLEARLEKAELTIIKLAERVSTLEEGTSDNESASALMQQGIDNILGYRGPFAGGDKK